MKREQNKKLRPSLKVNESKGRAHIKCSSCNKPRLIVSPNALKRQKEKILLLDKIDNASLFVCGQEFLSQEDKYEPPRKSVNIQVDRSILCDNHIEG